MPVMMFLLNAGPLSQKTLPVPPGNAGMLLRPPLRRQRGGMLLEALASAAILASVLSTAAKGLATGSRGVSTVHNLTTAQNLARSQMVYSLGDTYCAVPCTYSLIPAPPGYVVTADTQAFPGSDANLQYVVVTVSLDGKTLANIKALKANR
jgi:hypothetical protein